MSKAMSTATYNVLGTGYVAYQGEPGANSHIACCTVFPEATSLPCPTFEDAFAALIEGAADCAMIPIENSVAGRVADIHHLLPVSGLHITGEFFLPIHHQLMAKKGVTLESLTHVHSHVQALGQCRKTLRRLGLIPVAAADTAGSARLIAESDRSDHAAIAPRLAAELYGLEILAENIEDETHNTTRFIMLRRDALPLETVSNTLAITSFVFHVRNIPAALYKALGGFATNGVNMTKLESYMEEGGFTAAQFYAEIDGHPNNPAVQRAFDELRYFSRELILLGTYPAHPFRRQMAERAADA
jgi:prephenate dehydratase